jgi:hypothetical protein
MISQLENVGGYNITINSGHAFIGNWDFVQIIDITNPNNLEILSEFVAPARVASADVYGNYLYLAVTNALFISIYDISTITSPFEVNRFGFGDFYSIEISGDYLYVVLNTGAFRIYSLNDPVNPSLTSNTILNGRCYDIAIKDSLAFIPQFDSGLTVFNISNKFNPYETSSINWFGHEDTGPYRLVVENELILTATLTGMWVLTYAQGNLSEYSFYYTGGSSYKLKIKEDIGYVASSVAGLISFDFNDPYNPKFLGQLPSNEGTVDIALENNHAFLISDKSFSIIDINNPSELIKSGETTIKTIPAYTYLYSVAVSDTVAVITTGHNYITFINISDYTNPYIEIELPVAAYPADLFIYNNYLISAEYNSGLSIYDLTENPPTKIAEIKKYLPVLAIIVSGDRLYTAASGGLAIFDITKPDEPVELGYINTPGGRASVDLAYTGKFIYMAYGFQLEVINVSDPYAPFISGYISNNFPGFWGVDASANLVLVTKSIYGVEIYRNDLITGIKEVNSGNTNLDKDYTTSSIYPNPFNNYTNLNLDITNNSYIKIFLFNSIGQRIKTIVDEELSRGNHRIAINGSELSSGIYYLMVSTDFQKEVLKFIHLK